MNLIAEIVPVLLLAAVGFAIRYFGKKHQMSAEEIQNIRAEQQARLR